MEITPEFLIPVIIAAVAIIGLIWVIIKNRGNITPEKADSIIVQMYALAKLVYTSLKNDGKLDEAESKAIFEQIKVILAIIQGKDLKVIDAEFADADCKTN